MGCYSGLLKCFCLNDKQHVNRKDYIRYRFVPMLMSVFLIILWDIWILSVHCSVNKYSLTRLHVTDTCVIENIQPE